MQEKDALEHTNAKCHLRTLLLTCRPLCNIKHTPHNNIEHVHYTKILASALERHVSQTVKLLIISVNPTYTSKHGKVALNTINDVV